MSALDRGVLRQLCADIGDDTVADVFTVFIKDADHQIALMQDAVAIDNAEGVRRAAHALRSTALLLGAKDLAKLCGSLEELAGSGAVVKAVKAKVAETPAVYAAARKALTQELVRP